jgi:hypothetical protein
MLILNKQLRKKGNLAHIERNPGAKTCSQRVTAIVMNVPVDGGGWEV